MNIKIIDTRFCICKVETIDVIDFTDSYLFLGKTDEEISLVCSEDKLPKDYITCEKGYRGFCIQGELDFSLVGILANISNILAYKNISIFVISTFNTDYILVKEENLQTSLLALANQGYSIE